MRANPIVDGFLNNGYWIGCTLTPGRPAGQDRQLMRILFYLLILSGLIASDASAEERTWTNANGSKIQGEILSLD